MQSVDLIFYPVPIGALLLAFLGCLGFDEADMVWNYFDVAVCGILGCWARYYMTGLIQNIVGRGFPYATLTINVLGAFLMGFLFIVTLECLTISVTLRTGILTGGLGGFTTFSTFSMEALLLMEEGEIGRAVLYVLLSVILGLSAVFGGVYLARNL